MGHNQQPQGENSSLAIRHVSILSASFFNKLLVGLLLAALFSFVFAGINKESAYAAPPVVGLSAALTKTADGSTPFPTIDPNANNSLVATLDSASYTFDVAVNTLNAAPHNVRDITIIATLTSATAEVGWDITSLPTYCNTRTLSVDGKTLKCIIANSTATGSTLNVPARWYAQAGAPNGTTASVQFSVSAVMIPDASLGTSPAPATSNSNTVTIVSNAPSGYELRKLAGGGTGYTISSRDALGNPLTVDVDWGVQVEIKPPASGNLKGISTIGYGDVNFIDNLQAAVDATQLPINSVGTLVGCYPNFGVLQSTSTTINNQTFQNSGTWNCTQPGGIGKNVNINITGINWSPDWLPSSGNLWGMGDGSAEVYDSPAGTNNQAGVAIQTLRMRYAYSNIVAFDQNIGDKDNRTNFIRWCNEISNISVVGAVAGLDTPANNVACIANPFNNTSSISTAKAFTREAIPLTSTLNSPSATLGMVDGQAGPAAYEKYAQSGQKFAIALSGIVSTNSINGASNYVACDAIDNTKYNITTHTPTTLLTAGTSGTNAYYSWDNVGTPPAGFPSMTSSDIIVEFATTGSTFATQTAQRTVNCDNPALVWNTNPTLVAGGLPAVNLIRVRYLKPIAPGISSYIYISAQAKSGLPTGTILRNHSQTKYQIGSSVFPWQQQLAACDLDSASTTWKSSCINSASDRIYILGPVGNIQESDTITNPVDSPVTTSPGASWTYSIKAGMTFIANTSVTGVEVYNVLIPGSQYVSSTLTPDLIIPDCNANKNFACVSNPAARTNVGFTTLKWNRGNYNFVSSTPGTPYSDRGLFGQWDVTVKLGTFLPSGSVIYNQSWVRANEFNNNPALPIPYIEGNLVNKRDLFSGAYDDDRVLIATSNIFAVDKYVIENLPDAAMNDRNAKISLDGIAKYDLAFGNMAGIAKTMDAIDVLPYVGDGRSPATTIDGSYILSAAYGAVNPALINNIYITSDAPASINNDPNDPGNTAVGAAGRWKCTYAQKGTVGCPAANAITAIRIITNSIPAGQFGYVRIELSTSGNDGGELYTNNFKARASGLVLPVVSSDVTATTACLRVGNRFFNDIDNSGTYNAGDIGVDNVDLELVNVGPDKTYGTADDVVAKTTTTAGGGLYTFNCFRPGKFVVRVKAVERTPGNTLYGFVLAGSGQSNATNTSDEATDHNLLSFSGIWRTGMFDVDYGSNPVLEIGDHTGVLDADDNLTLDLGVRKVNDVELEKNVDANSDGVFARNEAIAIPGQSGNPDPTHFQYKIVVTGPESSDKSTGVVVNDKVPPGVTITGISSISQGSITTPLPLTGAPTTGTDLEWKIGTIDTGETKTLIVDAELHAIDLVSFIGGFNSGVSRNIVQVSAMDQTDIDSTPNNIVNYDTTNHEDDESDASVSIIPALGDLVWDDLNANGVQDSGEPGIEGVLVFLRVDDDGTAGPSSGDSIKFKTVTDVNGNYLFGGLDAGQAYYVDFDPSSYPAGYIVSPPDTTDDNFDSDVIVDNATDFYKLDHGELNQSVDLGLHSTLSLGNLVFQDDNNDGIKQSSELGIKGVRLQLFDAGDTAFANPLDTQVTDGDGKYLFSNLAQGKYRVRIENIETDTGIKYFSSIGSPGNSGPYEPGVDPENNIDDDDNGTQNALAVESEVIVVTYNDEPTNDGDLSPYSNLSLDFGFATKYSIGNRIFVDTNDNGILDGTESGYDTPLTLTLLNADETDFDSDPSTPGIQTLTTTTDTSGFYKFDGIPLGNYRVSITVPSGMRSSTDTPDTGDANTNSNNYDRGVGTSSGYTVSGIFTLGPSASEPTGDEDIETGSSDPYLPDEHRNMTIDFGLVPQFDLSVNKTLVTVGPFSVGQSVEFNLTATSNGPGAALGDISIVDRLPAGLTYASFTSPNAGEWDCVNNAPEIQCLRTGAKLSPGTSSTVKVRATIDAGVDLLAINTPLVNYTKVLPSTSETLHETNVLSSSNSGYETGDNSLGSNNDSSTRITNARACLRVGNIFFRDVDKNAYYSSGDDLLNHIDLELVSVGADNVYGGFDDVVIQTTTTNSAGAYEFSCFDAGKYVVRVKAQEFSSTGDLYGMIIAPNPQADANITSDEALDHNLLNVAGIYRSGVFDIGFNTQITGEAGSHIYTYDHDDNLTLDLGVQSINDVQLQKLVDVDGDDSFTKNEVIPTPGVGANPDPAQFKYSFNVNSPSYSLTNTGVVMTDIVRPGVTIISVDSISQGSLLTALPVTGAAGTGTPLVWNVGTVQGGDSLSLVLNAQLSSSNLVTFNSGMSNGVSRNVAQITTMNEPDVDSSPNNIGVYDPGAHEDDEDDASVTIPPALGDFVWNDKNANGIQDSGEAGIVNVDVQLRKDDDGISGPSSGDSIVYTSTTGIDGSYIFGGLNALTDYYVYFDPASFPANMTVSSKDSGANDAKDSDVSNITYSTGIYNLSPGEINRSADLGLNSLLSVGSNIFADANNNGVKDSGELGIGGVHIELFNASDTGFVTPIASTTSDGSGNYLFSGLDEGQYVVRVPHIFADKAIRYHSSSGAVGNTGAYEPGVEPENNIDDDDNGTQNVDMVVSGIINLEFNNEPINDGDTDAYTNLTVDFGFVLTYSLGNRVFIDKDDNGIFDGADTGYSSSLNVKLLNADESDYDSDPNTAGVQALSVAVDSQGFYKFDGLVAGDYRVSIVAPSMLRSSTDTVDTANANSDVNNIDHGIGVSDGYIVSGIVTLGVSEPTGEEDAQSASSDSYLPDAQRNMTVDFALVEPFDLNIVKTLNTAAPYSDGQVVEYKLLVSNDGPGPAKSDIVVTDELPLGLTYTSFRSDVAGEFDCVLSGTGIVCTRNVLNPKLLTGQSSTLFISAKINSPSSNGTITNVAKVDPSTSEVSFEKDPNTGSNNGSTAVLGITLANPTTTTTTTTAPVAVKGEFGILAFTGSNAYTLIFIALTLLVAGMVFATARSKRRSI